MRHGVALIGIVFVAIACSGTDTPREPVSVVVVDDSTGEVGGGMPSPDGSRLAFTKVVRGASKIFVSDPDGSNPVQISHGVWDANPIWSPDSKWVAYRGEAPDFDLYVVPSDGSAPEKLISGGPGNDSPMSWLPDGSGVVFNRSQAGDDHTMVVPLDGRAPRRVGPVVEGDMHATWAPGGGLLGYDVHHGLGATIWVQDSAAGSAPRQLTTEGLENGVAGSMWSPDGKQIAYTSRRTGTEDIWIMDVASGQSRQLTNDIRDDINPRWSPDGRMIAFISDRGGQRDLWVMPSAGGNAVRLTNDAAIETVTRWAPDGKSVYYVRNTFAIELQFVPIAGGPARTVHAWDEFNIGSARLSPDGKTILYDSPRIGNGDMFMLPAAGGEPVTFASSPLADYTGRWSPDGSQVAFLSTRGGSVDIWVVPAAGGEPRNLTASSGDEDYPEWSPDGTQVAFSSSRDVGGADLWVIASSGGTPKRLTHANLRPDSYQWSPDGRYLYFQGQRPGGSGATDWFRVAATGGQPEPLGANPRIGSARLSRDGKQVAYAAFERGLAYVHLMPSTGGPSRRITTDSTPVYQPFAMWSRGDSLLVVMQLDLVSNRDIADLFTYRLSDGRWQQLTRTVWGNEDVTGITPDGKDVLVILSTNRNQVKRAFVPELVTGRE